ncbi:MAG: hypothetical protein ACN4GF_06750 [Lentimonas sp.]
MGERKAKGEGRLAFHFSSQIDATFTRFIDADGNAMTTFVAEVRFSTLLNITARGGAPCP